MNDVYIIESWFGERLNVRHVYAADADDALQTHALHYPGEHIVSMQRGDGLSGRSKKPGKPRRGGHLRGYRGLTPR